MILSVKLGKRFPSALCGRHSIEEIDEFHDITDETHERLDWGM